MFRRSNRSYGGPRKIRVWDWFFLGALGSLLLGFVLMSLYRGAFNYRRRSEPITAADNPVFFWLYLLFLLIGASTSLYVACSEFKQWRRNRR